MDNRVVIYKSKSKAFAFIVASFILVIAGWLFLELPDKNVVGWSFIILSVLCLIFGIGTYLDKKPYIIMTEKGITELSSIREEIEWNEILQVDEFYYRGMYFIRVLVNKEYKSEGLRPTWFYRFDKLFQQEGIKALYIRTGFYEVNSIKLAGFMRKMMKADADKRIELLYNFRTHKIRN